MVNGIVATAQRDLNDLLPGTHLAPPMVDEYVAKAQRDSDELPKDPHDPSLDETASRLCTRMVPIWSFRCSTNLWPWPEVTRKASGSS